MAHFAEIKLQTDPSGFTSNQLWVVQRVVVVGDDIPTAAGPLGENPMHVDGETWCVNFFKVGRGRVVNNHSFCGKDILDLCHIR